MENYKQETVASQAAQPPDWLAIGTIVADVLVTCIVIAGMWIDKYSVTVAVLSGVTFFILFGALVILVLSGTLTAIVVNGQNQKTVRQLHRFQYNAQMEQAARVQVVDHPRLPSIPSAPPMQLPQSPTFVSAVPPADEQLKLACYQFVRALFDEGGRPLPKRILAPHTKSPGLVQYEKPKPDVVEYLTGLQMVWENERKQLFFNAELYPTLRKCITAIKLETPAGTQGVPPLDAPIPSPQYESGVAQ